MFIHKVCFFIAFMLLQMPAHAQDLFCYGEECYPATPVFTLQSDAKIGTHDLEVQIAKRPEGKGFLVLATEAVSDFKIDGNAMIYLDDGTVIKGLNRNIHDYVNNTAKTIYYLTELEINLLQELPIHSIRFNLRCGPCDEAHGTGTFTATNIDVDFGFKESQKTSTTELVEKLFAEQKEGA